MGRAAVIAISEVLAGERVHWQEIVEEFGFSMRFIDPDALQEMSSDSDLIAIILDYGKDCRRSAIEQLLRVRNGRSQPRLVLCHGIANPLEDRELDAAGAFDALARPLSDREVRQTLGFLWRSLERPAASTWHGKPRHPG